VLIASLIGYRVAGLAGSLIALVAATGMLTKRVHPLWLLAGGAALGSVLLWVNRSRWR
jgi:hypothetical protein